MILFTRFLYLLKFKPRKGVKAMKVYGQIIYESGSYATPRAEDYEQWDSLAEAKNALSACWNDMDVDPANGQGVTLVLWRGVPDQGDPFPCDMAAHYPDYVYELGPRGGVRRTH